MSDVVRLNLWFDCESVTGVQAAFMLAGFIPVKNPRPKMKGSIGDWYGHILHEVKVGQLATAGPVDRRIEVSTEYLDSLTMKELEGIESEWVTLDHPSEINTKRGTYHFIVEPATLVAWAEMFGWRHNPDGVSRETPSSKGNGLRVAAIRLIETSPASLGSTPHAVITTLNERLNAAGLGRPLTETSTTLRNAVALAKASAEPEYPQKLPPKGQDKITALWQLVAHRYEEPQYSDFSRSVPSPRISQ